MKISRFAPCILILILGPSPSHAHLLGPDGNDPHPHYDLSVGPPEMIVVQTEKKELPRLDETQRMSRPEQAVPFEVFAPKVAVRWDANFLYVASNGLPSHNMMVGITNWQQQVPRPQAYTGANSWRIPLLPVVAAEPLSIKNRFLRGAIALAVNGIPIFNPQNNRGEIAQEIGELDQWGGHCGRADDYHYHAAPLHLQKIVGKALPIAYALDGYPIYGLTEPDGSEPGNLDDMHGHTTPGLGYHYHASMKYPYVNGGFHGQVTERDGQVDPQPRAQTLRPAGSPLRGARITGFETTDEKSFRLSYELNGELRAIQYSAQADGAYAFEFQNGSAGTSQRLFAPRATNSGDRPAQPNGPREERPSTEARRPQESPGPAFPEVPTSKGFLLTTPAAMEGGNYPVEFTGDGAGSTPPLDWTGIPEGTRSLALIMHHAPKPGEVKYYWTLYNLPPNLTHLEKNAQDVGTLGLSFRGRTGYEPPHSKGPGPKTYVITLLALSEPPKIDVPAAKVSPEVLLRAIQGHILAGADLKVVYTRGQAGPEPNRP